MTYRIFVVDDEPILRESLRAILEDEFEVEVFASSEDCLQRAVDRLPDLFLLDIELPGMDGYALCREIRQLPGGAEVPVTFVSGHEDIEARLAGYEAGGTDFIVKPADADEVLRKVRVAARIARQRQQVHDQAREQAQAADQMTELLLANMNDYTVLVQFLGKMTGCASGLEVAEDTLKMLSGFQLAGAVQIRCAGAEINLGHDGRDVPLEVSVLNHVRTLERIFEFRNRGVYNFTHITVLINNMPLHDADTCGRIRDNMAIAVQGADSRLAGIEADWQNQRKQAAILELMQDVKISVDALQDQQRLDRADATAIAHALHEEMIKSFVHLGLTDNQEHILEDLIRDHMGRLIAVIDRGEETQGVLQSIAGQLQRLE